MTGLRPREARADVRGAALGLCLGCAMACQGGADDVSGDPGPSSTVTSLTPSGVAPDFSALSHIGYTLSLDGLARERPVAVYFCDVLLEPRCSALADTLRDGWLRINQRLAMLLFVTPHTSVANAAHAREHELPFLLVSDREHSIAQAFGLSGDAVSSPRGYLIGPGRKLIATYDELDPGQHLAELERGLSDAPRP